MSKNLFIIQGINKDKYMSVEDVQRAGFPVSRYESYKYIDTESILDKHMGWLNMLPWGDKIGDVLRFYVSGKCRGDTRRLLRDELLATTGKTDVLAHSLGSIITLTSGKPEEKLDFGNLYLMGCPLALKSWLGRKMFVHPNYKKHVRSELEYANISCDNIYFLWSPNDSICGFANNDIRKLLEMVDVRNKIVFAESNSDHSWESYLIDLVNDLL